MKLIRVSKEHVTTYSMIKNLQNTKKSHSEQNDSFVESF